MTRLPFIALLFLLTGLFLAGGPAGAAPPSVPTASGGGKPTHVEADRMVSLKGDNAVLFTGNVDARQGALIIRSDEMTIYYFSDEEKLPAGQEGGRKLKKLFAKGNVTIRDEGWTATGAAMEYFEVERKVVLTDNARVWQDKNLVTGDTVIIFLDEGKSIVERGAKKEERVKAYFYSGDDKPAEGEKKAPEKSKTGTNN
jgi:lipopolysaccharide export system protein LptA